MASCYSGATASAVRFRYTGRFFSVDRFQDENIQFFIRHLELSITVETFRANYPSAVVYRHRSVILDKLGYFSFESKKSEFDYELGRLVAKRLRPKQVFYQMIRHLKAHPIVLPTAQPTSILLYSLPVLHLSR